MPKSNKNNLKKIILIKRTQLLISTPRLRDLRDNLRFALIFTAKAVHAIRTENISQNILTIVF